MNGRRRRDTFIGSFRSWKEPWGFVVCPEAFGGDLFAHRDNIVGPSPPGDLTGMECEFEEGEDKKGRRTATMITVLSGSGRPEDMDAPMRPFRQPEPLRMMRRPVMDWHQPRAYPSSYGRAAPYPAFMPMALPSRGARSSSDNPRLQRLVGERLRGEVRHWKGDWGFLICPARFDGDIFAHSDNWLLRDTPQDGMQVSFTVSMDKKGRITAAEVTEADSTEAIPRPEDCLDVGQMSGKVRSWRRDWGFIVSEQFEGDLFCHQDNVMTEFEADTIESRIVGRNVSFEVKLDKRGRVTAHRVTVEDSGDTAAEEAARLTGPGANFDETEVKHESSASDASFNDEEWYSGTCRSWKGDWGFIVAPESFEGDVFAHKDNLRGLASLATGDAVSFQVGKDKKGRNTALNIKPENRGEKAEDWLDSHAQLRGHFRTWKLPWGFIVSDSYTGDLFAHMENFSRLMPIEHIRDGMEVTFRIRRDAKGRCTAMDVEPAGKFLRSAPARRPSSLPPMAVKRPRFDGLF